MTELLVALVILALVTAAALICRAPKPCAWCRKPVPARRLLQHYFTQHANERTTP